MPALQEISETLIQGQIVRAVPDVFKTMLGLPAALVQTTAGRIEPWPPLSPVPSSALPHVVGTVGFLGDASGLIYIYLEESFACQCTASLLGMTAAELQAAGPEPVNDAVGELTNMIVGVFKNGLCDCGFSCKLTIPSILRGSNFCVKSTGAARRFIYFFEVAGSRVVADILMQTEESEPALNPMRHKILTVDDSKTVRIIVRKAFKTFDCEILEAANGVEGLALAAKDAPDLILLDVTMPVMDGVEMLTKLKADPLLKGIPVMMLTAEGGREHVLKIAKIGVRDYIVKPFKEDVLVEKTGRIIDLKPVSDGPAKVRTILDALELLVVEDKPAIIQQIQDGLKHTPWIIRGAGSIAEAQTFCARQTPDLLLMSLSLPDEGAFNLLRTLRASPKTKYTPAFALVVKTEVEIQAQAQQLGFGAIITKPIDMGELEGKAAKAMNLDTSQRYFRTENEHLIMTVPENCSAAGLIEAGAYLKPKLAEAVDAGQNKVIFDLQAMRSLHMGLIRLLLHAMATARELGVQFAIVGNAQLAAECKGFEDTRGWAFYPSLGDAKLAIGKELVGA